MPESIDTGTAGKTLSQLVVRVGQGEIFILTRYGKPVAMLGPIGKTLSDRVATDVIKPVESKVEIVNEDTGLDDWGLPEVQPHPAAKTPMSFGKPVTDYFQPTPKPGARKK